MAGGMQPNEPTRAQVVVGFGASGANVKSVLLCLTHLHLGPETAVVIVLHHREALDYSGFVLALEEAGHTLTPIEDGQEIKGGCLYLPAPDVIITAEGGFFQERAAQGEPGSRGTLDSFLISLAKNEDGHSIAVLFADVGGDGTLGAAAVKEAGGLVLAEETDEVRADALASANSPAALADVILKADKLAARIESHARQLTSAAPKSTIGDQTTAALASIVAVLRNKTGHDFHGYKEGTFWRRVQRRMQVHEAPTVEEYLGLIRANPDEPQHLFNDLLIGVTQFFRDHTEFERVERTVIPQLFEGKSREDHLRVWVIGCSTGEEAYSLAILLREHMATLEEIPQVQVFATDLDGRALASARAGRYPNTIAKEMSADRLARWFVKQGDTFVVAKELREMCIFSQHSVIKDAPFSRLDMISCRNLLIYLDPELQSKVIPLFHFALKPTGYLFLGNSENVSRHANLFSPLGTRSRVFRRLDTPRRVLPDFPFTAVEKRFAGPTTLPAPAPSSAKDLERAAERISDRHAPAYVIVDAEGNILHFSGRTGRFIEPAVGAPNLNVHNFVHPDLRIDLRAALTQAIETQAIVRASNIRMGANGGSFVIDLAIEPVPSAGKSSPYYVILFKDGAPIPAFDGSEESGTVSAAHVQRLEAELRTTTERLQATVEELESTNEELKSANEEYQSLNEELQSANEELETSKEELQSINEELTTVNGELAHRVQELGRSNSDLKNFLESTQIATVFLDNDLRVMNYTPAITDIFHLVDSDIGRPITHIKSQLLFDNLQDEVTRVLRTLGTVEHEVANPTSGARYVMRILPYRSTNNFIAGVVVTFVDITERKQAEEAIRDREERFRLIVENARDYAIFVTDTDGTIVDWPAGAAVVFGWSAEEAIGQSASIVYVPEDRAQGVPEAELSSVREKGFAPNVRWHLRKDGSRVFIEGSARALKDASGRLRGVLKIGQDVTERRRADTELRERESEGKLLLAELQHRVRNTLAVVRSIATRTATTSTSVEEYASHLEGRLSAFARVQAVVTRNPQVGVDLESLIAEELHAYAAKEGELVDELRGPAIRLRSKAAELLALAIHELTVNAVKYGALSTEGGHLAVAWNVTGPEDARQLVIRWAESGVKLDPRAETRTGFGTELLERTLRYELGGETSITYREDGLYCEIRIPMTEQLSMGKD